MKWVADYEQAKVEAKEQRKLILLQFEMDDCSGCRKLYAETILTTYKLFALLGASADPEKYSNALLKVMQKAGLRSLMGLL